MVSRVEAVQVMGKKDRGRVKVYRRRREMWREMRLEEEMRPTHVSQIYEAFEDAVEPEDEIVFGLCDFGGSGIFAIERWVEYAEGRQSYALGFWLPFLLFVLIYHVAKQPLCLGFPSTTKMSNKGCREIWLVVTKGNYASRLFGWISPRLSLNHCLQERQH